MFFIEFLKWLFRPSKKITQGLAQTVVDAKPQPGPATGPAGSEKLTPAPVHAPKAANAFGNILKEK